MEASALQAPAGLARRRSTIGLAVLRLRSDEQLVELLRSGHEEAFDVIHDRYRQRLFAYMRQMLPQRQDAEDALQEVFERAYSSLSVGDRELALRPWLYRIAHNRCVDHLRRPLPPPPEAMLQLGLAPRDPILEADRRETLRRLMADVRRLPEQQRSALLMRELGGIPYAEVAQALGVTVPAVKSLLVRARISLVQAGQARDAACTEIRAELVHAHEGRMRPNAIARRHLRDCPGCRDFRSDLRGVRRQLLALSPSLAPCALLARLLGGTAGPGGGAAAAACGGSAASGIAGGSATGLVGTGGILASAGALASGAGHVATLIAATVVTAGGAAEIQRTIIAPATHSHHHAAAVAKVVARAQAPVARAIVHSGLISASSPTSPATTIAAADAAETPVGRSGGASALAGHRSRPATSVMASDQLLAPIPDPQPAQDATQAGSAALTAIGPGGSATAPTGTGASGNPGAAASQAAGVAGSPGGRAGTSSTGPSGSTVSSAASQSGGASPSGSSQSGTPQSAGGGTAASSPSSSSSPVTSPSPQAQGSMS